MKSGRPSVHKAGSFQPASRGGKANYLTSRNQSLSKKKKKITLSPVRSEQRSSPQLKTVCPHSQQLFENRDQVFATTDEQSDFVESWPYTECGSSPASTTPSSYMDKHKPSTISSEPGYQQDSVLAKYIERFRHGQPQSREERQQTASAIGEKQLPFWWMSPSALPLSSTPTKTTDEDDHKPAIFSRAGQLRLDRSLSPCRRSLSNLSDTYQGEFEDTDILLLQGRANRLLLRDDCALGDGSVHVSSDGLGCSDFSSTVSVDEPVRGPLISCSTKSTAAKAVSDSIEAWSSQKAYVVPSLVPPARPEEDILFQWRLRRKIEQAREGPQSVQHSSHHSPTFSWQAPSSSHALADGQAYKQQLSIQPPEFSQKATHPHISAPQPETTEAHRSCPPALGPSPFPAFVASSSSVSQAQTVAHVPAHMHLLCDVLPCPEKQHANVSQTTDGSQTKVVHKKTQVDTFTDEPIREHILSPLLASPGVIRGEGPSHHKRTERNTKERAPTKESEKIEKKTAASLRKQKKSPRYTVDKEHADGPGPTNRSSSLHRVPKKVTPRAEQQQQQQQQQQQEGSQEFSSGSCTGDHAPPPSPIHSALGQVVSEVLFPTSDPSPTQRTPVSLLSPVRNATALPRCSSPPYDAHNSMEVISQLLQEADDSDEKEFEDDPLLQVLRKQRQWVKEQISEVDSMLDDFLDEQQ